MSRKMLEDPPDEELQETGTPTWVKVFAVATVLVLVLLVVLLVFGGDHGPGRHALALAW